MCGNFAFVQSVTTEHKEAFGVVKMAIIVVWVAGVDDSEVGGVYPLTNIRAARFCAKGDIRRVCSVRQRVQCSMSMSQEHCDEN